MRRRLFNFLSAVSLLLCLCLAALWVFSYFRAGWLDWVNPSATINTDAFAERGQIHADLVTTKKREQRIGLVPGFRMRSSPSDFADLASIRDAFSWHDYGYVHTSIPEYGLNDYLIILPIWLLMLPTLILPATWLLRRRRARLRRTRGLCPHCGYDLRATPGRCPECGRPKSEDQSPRMATNEHE
ncbi:MAG TPA: hypothetical protein VFE47_18515 [Tepidisphaeraceae bacterium]|jgi:hypothetical protein|nr:hypothetical protein [Tepidisphaeraceae bacterium]